MDDGKGRNRPNTLLLRGSGNVGGLVSRKLYLNKIDGSINEFLDLSIDRGFNSL